jgi:hypothetical protein
MYNPGIVRKRCEFQKNIGSHPKFMDVAADLRALLLERRLSKQQQALLRRILALPQSLGLLATGI